MDQPTETVETLPATPIRMYVVEKVQPNGDVEIMAVEYTLGEAQHFAQCGTDAAQCHVRPALLHYDRPRMAYGKVRFERGLQRLMSDMDATLD
jgi:hypothetical protein